MSVRSKAKIRCSSSITKRWTHSSQFDVPKMMFNFVRCSIKWCSIHHYYKQKLTFDNLFKTEGESKIQTQVSFALYTKKSHILHVVVYAMCIFRVVINLIRKMDNISLMKKKPKTWSRHSFFWYFDQANRLWMIDRRASRVRSMFGTLSQVICPCL